MTIWVDTLFDLISKHKSNLSEENYGIECFNCAEVINWNLYFTFSEYARQKESNIEDQVAYRKENFNTMWKLMDSI